jgi:uncharacterized membrane-anchored protein YhcB (DUF1043 family)
VRRTVGYDGPALWAILPAFEEEVSVEIWIVLLLAVAGLSGWAGYFWASRRAPKRAQLDALAAELDEARRRADAVQTSVDEHFEQSARLFGKLAGDYREFLEHFAGSAQALGLSESRTRELVQQSFQPLLTHEVDDLVVSAETGAAAAVPASPEPAPEPEGTVAMSDAVSEAVSEENPEPTAEVRVAEVTLKDASSAPADEPADDVQTTAGQQQADETSESGETPDRKALDAESALPAQRGRS